MSADTVRMANQIAKAFATDPRKAEEVAAHIKSFWTRAMTAELRSAAAAGAGLDPIVKDALKLLPAE